MFDVYVHAHAPDLAARRRLTIALLGAATVLAGAMVATVSAERLSIARVAPPSVALDFVMTTAVLPLTLVPPPPIDEKLIEKPRETPQDAVTDRTVPEPELKPPPIEGRVDAEEGPDDDVTGPRAPGGPTGTLARPPGGPPCLIPGCKVGPARPAGVAQPAVEPGRELAPIDHVKARALAIPDPSEAALARTAAALERRAVRVAISFCVDPSGHATEVRTARSSGDAEVDRICRATVGGWRFRPANVNGRAITTCTETTFDIHFD